MSAIGEKKVRNGAIKAWAAGNWFLLALPLLLAVSVLFTRTNDWRGAPGAGEAVTLFDWAVTVPFLYFLCYRSKLGAKQMSLRLVGLACLGVWVASKLVPAGAQEILPHLTWPRWAGLAVLALVELRLLILVMKLACSGQASAEELARTSGVPPLLARLMLLEAAFWRAVWRLIRRR